MHSRYISNCGQSNLICPFHRNKNDVLTLHIDVNGNFVCWECHKRGNVSEHEGLHNAHIALKASLLERNGQLRLPGI